MSLDLTLISRNRVVGLKAETTTGTAITPVASDCGLFGAIYDVSLDPTIQMNKRQSPQYLSPPQPVPGTTAGTLKFRSELFGSDTAGTLPSWASVIFPACGCQINSAVVSPLSPSASVAAATLSGALYQSGRLLLLAGCMGDFVIRGKSGEPLYLEWTFQGVWQSPSETAIPTGITYPPAKPPRFAGATFTAGSNVLRVEQFQFKSGNQIYLRQDPTAVDGSSVGTGLRAALIVDRLPTISLDPEAQSLSTLNWFAAQMAMTTYSFTATVGAAGTGFTLAAPYAQVNSEKHKDRGGLITDDLEFVCTGTADNEWTLTAL